MLNFIVPIYKDEHFAIPLLEQLLQHHPGSQVLLLSDGASTPSFAYFCRSKGLSLAQGIRLKHRPDNSWSIRFFEAALRLSNASIVVKLDPDCGLNGPLELPAQFDICASLRGGKAIVGGCIAFSHSALESLLDFAKTGPSFTYYGSRASPLLPLHSQDRLINAAFQERGLELVELPKNGICWAYPPQYPKQYTVFHPRLETIPLLGQSCQLESGKPDLKISPKAATCWQLWQQQQQQLRY